MQVILRDMVLDSNCFAKKLPKLNKMRNNKWLQEYEYTIQLKKIKNKKNEKSVQLFNRSIKIIPFI